MFAVFVCDIGKATMSIVLAIRCVRMRGIFSFQRLAAFTPSWSNRLWRSIVET